MLLEIWERHNQRRHASQYHLHLMDARGEPKITTVVGLQQTYQLHAKSGNKSVVVKQLRLHSDQAASR
ncbi:hypothetical protein T265_03715 [Opisthorchis viverrini]|uniref:Uncharacterized protein n=1 Tax=Opisthorchis viverrini TaxID=6198 RepID=A0A074ZQN5_OPIVI|nr:hypothetical protein T265_03715 [Opisthorchis viverrini]KER29698.1 hypothetical protein T265_03715 [Opisthorchis viverrini]